MGRIRSLSETRRIRITASIIGSNNVGKSELISCLRNTQPADTSELVNFSKHTVKLGSALVELQMWDLSWEARSHQINVDIAEKYLDTSEIVFICFSLADRDSFLALKKHIELVNQYAVKKPIVALVGTKSDLPRRQVATKEFKKFAKQGNYFWKETSAKTKESVNALFTKVLKLLSYKKPDLFLLSGQRPTPAILQIVNEVLKLKNKVDNIFVFGGSRVDIKVGAIEISGRFPYGAAEILKYYSMYLLGGITEKQIFDLWTEEISKAQSRPSGCLFHRWNDTQITYNLINDILKTKEPIACVPGPDR